MRESGCGTESALNFFYNFDVHRSKLDSIIALPKSGEIVQRSCEFRRVGDKVSIQVNKSEKQLDFSNRRGSRPVKKHEVSLNAERRRRLSDDRDRGLNHES